MKVTARAAPGRAGGREAEGAPLRPGDPPGAGDGGRVASAARGPAGLLPSSSVAPRAGATGTGAAGT